MAKKVFKFNLRTILQNICPLTKQKNDLEKAVEKCINPKTKQFDNKLLFFETMNVISKSKRGR